MKILLATLHAKYAHSSLALPCLASFCRDLPEAAIVIREWTVNEPREQLLRLIIEEAADIIGFSCYLWNIEQTLILVSDIKQIAPQTRILLGGPEVSFDAAETMSANPAIDYIIAGEGEKPFRELLEELLKKGAHSPERLAEIRSLFSRHGDSILSAPEPILLQQLDAIPSPFAAGLVDLQKPLVYYETSRGCPFSCAFCLSSIDGPVRSFSIERIQEDLLFLMERHVSQIKLVDRTFNYDALRAGRIWEFILAHNRQSHFHFEIAADLLTEDNCQLLAKVPENTFRFEIGVQSVSGRTLSLVGRTARIQQICTNVRRLKRETRVELHLDLVAGLPEEDYAGFLDSLQTVADLEPDEIQIEPLKLLKGTRMRKIADREGYGYSRHPPYTILSTPRLSFQEISRIETLSRLLDLFQKHGGFAQAFAVLKRGRPHAAILDLMARTVGNQNLSSLSRRRVYELFADCAADILAAEERTELYDALFFDYCLQEIPLMGKLPSFAGNRPYPARWPGRRDLPVALDLPPDCRIRAFSTTFATEYGTEVKRSGPAGCTFVYAAGNGEGLSVKVIWENVRNGIDPQQAGS